jgi:hypothetical protein
VCALQESRKSKKTEVFEIQSGVGPQLSKKENDVYISEKSNLMIIA